MYKGWKIYTYNRTISKAEEPIIRNALKARFNRGDWCYSENTHRAVILYGPNRQQINVKFEEKKYSSKRDKDVETYHIVFESPFFGFRTREERAHKEVYRKVYQKIPWKKLGFWLQDNVQVPIHRFRILRRR